MKGTALFAFVIALFCIHFRKKGFFFSLICFVTFHDHFIKGIQLFRIFQFSHAITAFLIEYHAPYQVNEFILCVITSRFRHGTRTSCAPVGAKCLKNNLPVVDPVSLDSV